MNTHTSVLSTTDASASPPREVVPRRPEPRRVFAMGGGGFSDRLGDPSLDRYVLDVAIAPRPRICLLPTAGGDAEEQIRRFYRAFRDLPCEATHLSLFRLGTEPVDLRQMLLDQDILYVGGGSLLNLLAVWRAHGLDGRGASSWRASAPGRCAGSRPA